MQESSWVFRNFDEMALGKKRLGAAKSSSNSNRSVVSDGGLGLGFELVKYKRGFGKKRVLISGGEIRDSGEICDKTLGKSRELEALPQDLLVRLLKY